MIGQIKYIADVQGSCRHQKGTWEEFVEWILQQKSIQLDIETDVSQWWCDKKLISLQFGSCTYERVQWFLQYSELTKEQMLFIKQVLENPLVCKLIHNATFEYVVLRFYGIIIENVFDTMLAEKVIKGGEQIEDYALADISYKYLRIIMDKSLQMAFGDNIITEAKIDYGVTDVAYLDAIRIQQIFIIRELNLMNVLALENEAVLAFGDITFEGMELDQEKWRDNINLAQPIVEESKAEMDMWLVKEGFHEYAVAKGHISNEDRVVINMASPPQKAYLLQLVFPDIIGASQPVIKKYIRDNSQNMNSEELSILVSLQSKDTEPLLKYCMKNFRKELISEGYLVPAYTGTINWNSRDQALKFIQDTCLPKLTSLSADEVAKFSHPILDTLTDYKDALKLITTYGETFIEKYVEPDGKVRTNFNQVVSTGRVSSARPNMQNIPAKESVGTRYRNAFVCESDWEFVDSDYISQELVIIAHVSQDPVWMEAINTGKDLHSVCAELVYGPVWKEAADVDCAYYTKGKQKCKCKKHKVLRDGVKTINFG